MRRIFLVLTTLVAASFLLVSCEPAPNNTSNATNKPANAANNSTANTASSASTEADIKKLMGDIASALAKNDADAASKFYSDDYHLITPEGVDQDRTARIADMRSGATKFDTFSYENIKVRSYGDTAVAIATVKTTGTIGGKPRTGGDIMATLVFRKMGNEWKIVSGQATPVTATAAPAKTGDAANAADANKPAASNMNK